MNGVISAQTLQWQDSAAFDPDLALSVNVLNVYRFNGRATLDPAFRQSLTTDSARVFADHGLERWLMPLSSETINRLVLSDKEMSALSEVSERVCRNGIKGQMTLEGQLAELGYGMPAIAVVVVAVAVAVFLWVIAVP